MSSAKKVKKIDTHYIAALLEDLRSQFRAFGEGLVSVERRLGSVERKGEATFDIVGKLQEKVDELTLEARWVRAELRFVKVELAELKKLLTQKADIEKLEALEKEVSRLEKLIAKIPLKPATR